MSIPNKEKLTQVSQGYRELADLIDEMIAFEESGIEDENKEAELLGKFMIKAMSLQSLAE